MTWHQLFLDFVTKTSCWIFLGNQFWTYLKFCSFWFFFRKTTNFIFADVADVIFSCHSWNFFLQNFATASHGVTHLTFLSVALLTFSIQIRKKMSIFELLTENGFGFEAFLSKRTTVDNLETFQIQFFFFIFILLQTEVETTQEPFDLLAWFAP